MKTADVKLHAIVRLSEEPGLPKFCEKTFEEMKRQPQKAKVYARALALSSITTFKGEDGSVVDFIPQPREIVTSLGLDSTRLLHEGGCFLSTKQAKSGANGIVEDHLWSTPKEIAKLIRTSFYRQVFGRDPCFQSGDQKAFLFTFAEICRLFHAKDGTPGGLPKTLLLPKELGDYLPSDRKIEVTIKRPVAVLGIA